MHNQKGGVGKTTSAVCLAGALAESDRVVTIIDMDPQADASVWLGADHPYTSPIGGVLRGASGLDRSIEPTALDNLTIIPASDQLRTLEDPDRPLQDVGHSLLHDHGRDWVIVDCAPSWSPLIPYSQMGVQAADHVIIPITASGMDLEGLSRTREQVESYTADDDWWVLYSRVDRRASYTDEVERKLTRSLPTRLCPCQIRENITLAEAPASGEPITEYASHSRGASDFKQLATWTKEVLR
jgi:chromosome partitioning protein